MLSCAEGDTEPAITIDDAQGTGGAPGSDAGNPDASADVVEEDVSNDTPDHVDVAKDAVSEADVVGKGGAGGSDAGKGGSAGTAGFSGGAGGSGGNAATVPCGSMTCKPLNCTHEIPLLNQKLDACCVIDDMCGALVDLTGEVMCLPVEEIAAEFGFTCIPEG